MNHRTMLAGLAAAGLLLAGCARQGSTASSTLSTTPRQARSADLGASLAYPNTRTVSHTDTYHGVRVADPYRWLEDGESAGTAAWVEAQNKVTFPFIEAVPERETIKSRLTALWDYERFGMPWKEGGKYFYTYNDGLMNQSQLFVMDSLNATPRLLLDPNTLSADGTISVAGYAVSPDGKHLAYSISDGGSDWREWKVRDIATGRDLSDHIKWSKFSGASWLKDGSGFFYSRYDEPTGAELASTNFYQKLYFHQVGTPQSEDMLVYERPDQKNWGFGGSVTDDGRFLIISVTLGTDRRNGVFYLDLASPDSGVVELLSDFDASYSFIDNDGPIFWFNTDLDAPKGRVVAINISRPSREYWEEIIPETAETLRGVSAVGGRFFASYLKDAATQVRIFGLGGESLGEVRLPGIGSAGGFGGKRSENETFYSYSSYTTPPTVFRYDVASGRSEVFRSPDVAVNPADYVTRQVFYTSKDGTRVPMFITHKKGLKRDGQNPTILYGYGGFNIPMTPGFSVANIVWLEMGGVYAVANLRGGGEYGKEWHQAGTKLLKQNVFDDFIAAAEWLIDAGYTSTPKLAISGGSNGGLLVGAVMTQRPDLFGACLPAVGVLDMLRFESFTIGWAWASDYGSVQNKDEFEALRAYSPYHNIKDGVCYPPTLVTTADRDDRVVPAHSFKFAARLQAAQGCDNPVLIRIETRAGHGAGKPTTKQIEERADIYSFLVRALKMEPELARGGFAAARARE